jgi:hypothetical protein
MKPIAKKNMDDIDRLLQSTWVEPPDDLLLLLMDIPGQVAPGASQRAGVITIVLEMIMAVWGLTTVYIFRGLWLPIVHGIQETLSLPNLGWGSWFSVPFTALLTVMGFIFVTWWMVADVSAPVFHPSLHKNKGPR